MRGIHLELSCGVKQNQNESKRTSSGPLLPLSFYHALESRKAGKYVFRTFPPFHKSAEYSSSLMLPAATQKLAIESSDTGRERHQGRLLRDWKGQSCSLR